MVFVVNELGVLLRKTRHEKGLTMKQVAVNIGVHHSLISTYEVGKRNPSLHALRLLSDFYGIPYITLLNLRLDKKGIMKVENTAKRNNLKMKKALNDIDKITDQRAVRRIIANVLFEVEQ